MTLSSRFRTRRLAARLAALFVGAWLFAALSPCVMAMDHPCGEMDSGKTCMQTAEPCGLAAVDCQLTDPNPPSTASLDLPVPLPVVVLSVRPAHDPLAEHRARARTRHNAELPGAYYPLQHVRLLI
jgi:hypothetical protein